MAARILVVDDNLVNLKLAACVLENEGFEVQKAVSAELAIQEIESKLPDRILMDVALPGMDGLSLTRKLKAERSTRHVVVVAVTAFAMKGDEERTLAAGCDGYISKPIDTRTFADQVRSMLEKRRPVKVLLVAHDDGSFTVDSAIPIELIRRTVPSLRPGELDAAIRSEAADALMVHLSGRGSGVLDLARTVKEDPRTCELPVVALSTDPELCSPEEAEAAGCDAFFALPIDDRALYFELVELSTVTNPSSIEPP